jgi:hypothetical protein
MRGEKETRHLSFVLTEDEARERGRELAKVTQAYDEKDAEKKESAKKFKDELEDLDKERCRLQRVLLSGTEDRPVECTWSVDHARGVMRLIRDDNDLCIESRPMTDDERQGRFM